MLQPVLPKYLVLSSGDNSCGSERAARRQGVRRQQGVSVVEEHRGQCEESGEDAGLRPLQDRGRGGHRGAERGGGQDGFKVPHHIIPTF